MKTVLRVAATLASAALASGVVAQGPSPAGPGLAMAFTEGRDPTVDGGPQSPISLTAERTVEPQGWMRGGYGNYRFILKNAGPNATIVRWSAHWEAKGKSIGGAWGGEINAPLPEEGTSTREEIGYLPADVVEAAKPVAPEMVGAFTVRVGADERSLPFRLSVPEAVLPEPLRTIRGKAVALSLMASRYKGLKTADRALGWLDGFYASMIDLTGEHPYGGSLMVYLEAPEHPYWAYAGREMVLNTKFVGESVQGLDAGLVPFGWVHEVGHNFDEAIGPWYVWSGPCAEFQANFKLAYAVTRERGAAYRFDWRTGSPAYGQSETTQPLTGTQLVDGFYGTFGDAYLADPRRGWDTMASDDIQTLFQRLVYAYGWEPFKRWYRTYRRLADAGMKPPEAPEDKVALAVAILSRETGHDLLPTFRMWRFPTTTESVAAMRAKYGL